MPWDGGQVEPGSEPTRSAEVVASRYDTGGGSGPYGTPPPRKNRSLLIVLLSLLVVAILAIVALILIRPKASLASGKATATPSPSTSSPSPPATSASPPASSGLSPGATTGTSTSPGVTAGTVGTTGGGAGAEVADLSALNPVQSQNISGPSPGPEQIGATTYQNSVGFTCYPGSGFFDYSVAGYRFLTAIIGIPSNASNAAGNALTITFFKDGSSAQLGSPVTVSLDHPQSVHLNLQGTSQLEIACSAISQTAHASVSMDGALGNATIGPS